MKKTAKKVNAVRLAFRLIKERRLANKAAKDIALVLVPAIKRALPASKVSVAHVSWYRKEYRRRLKIGLPTDSLSNKRR